MTAKRYERRQVLKGLASCAAALVPPPPWLPGPAEQLRVAGQPVEARICSVSERTVRLILARLRNGLAEEVPRDGSLMPLASGPHLTFRNSRAQSSFSAGNVRVQVSHEPLAFTIQSAAGQTVQHISIDSGTGLVSFDIGDAPLLGLGEGGRQFDRRGSIDAMRSGQGGYELATHGGRVPIPWLVGTAGWALFFHHPFGAFDLTGPIGVFRPPSTESAFPLDLFVVSSSEPAAIMSEYARLTGHAEMPPLWSFGYQQSHRTLGSPDEILAEAKTFREKRLPCDTMIYLGTGFCPNGWNTENGSFVWNSRAFPDPPKMIDELHRSHFHVVPHVVILTDRLRGTVRDACEVSRFDEESASCYWDMHRRDFAMGVDGWWPDEGDSLDAASRLVRNRMYWEGPQIDRPNQRPYALHRNGYAGMQRYGSFLWSGDVYSTWETLKTHVPVALNAALSGIPYWGTDIGGFVPTKEFTAELYLRWFQFGAFCTLFRCHGRAWKLRLPWGWDTGDPGPTEIRGYGGAAVPDASQLHNPDVEPICRKYLELRYKLLPYLYSAVRESSLTGVPVMRALWLHYPDDGVAVARGDEYLWGRDILVAPVVEKGASSRSLYLPRGTWYDFWTQKPIEGGREVTRDVDLATLPLYVRAGSILPMGPVRQYVGESVEEPLRLLIHPGADGALHLYEDDGISFNYRRGDWTGIDLRWDDSHRRLSLSPAKGSKMVTPLARQLSIELGERRREVRFEGRSLTVVF